MGTVGNYSTRVTRPQEGGNGSQVIAVGTDSMSDPSDLLVDMVIKLAAAKNQTTEAEQAVAESREAARKALETMVERCQRILEQGENDTFYEIAFLDEALHEINEADRRHGSDCSQKVAAQRHEGLLETVVQEKSNRELSKNLPYPELWKIQVQQMHEQLKLYLLEQTRESQNTEHLYFELAFGMEEETPDGPNELHHPDPIAIETPEGKVMFRGRIDRVDRVNTGEKTGLLVVDYKSGGLTTHKAINAGRNLQMPVYTLATKQLSLEDCLGGAFHRIPDRKKLYYSEIKTPRGEKRSFDERLAGAAAQIGTFVKQMADGKFDALPSHKCSSWCPFRQICHYSPSRADIKMQEVSS